jgi:UDP-glucose 4-epimerase
MAETLNGKNILIVGGAGFVGSNLARMILQENPGKLTSVGQFPVGGSGVNVPQDPCVWLLSGWITDDRILRGLNNNLDYAFHLACFHGNRSSIHDPVMDHDNTFSPR